MKAACGSSPSGISRATELNAQLRKRRSPGFTLLEMIVVVLIIGVVTATALPLFSTSFGGLRVRDAKSDLLAVVAHAQEMAVRHSKEYRVYVDEKENAYWVAAAVELLPEGEMTSPFDVRPATAEAREEQQFEGVTDTWGKLRYLPEGMQFSRPKLRKDKVNDYKYLGCYPNGASDIAEIQVVTEGRGGSRFQIETLGAMGQFEVKDR